MRLEYKRDKLKDGSKTIANIKGDKLRSGTGSTTLCNVRGDKVAKGTGSSTLCNVRNGDIRDGTGSSRKAKVKDIKKMIRGSETLADVYVAAIWQTFIR
ncbi:MAG: hypothetical protein ACKJRS_07585 [Woeseiaceae bacterium]|tara:strand:+ start:256 stop:552 length:297 start_codon:yes stop_codon:yes gene_type:complete